MLLIPPNKHKWAESPAQHPCVPHEGQPQPSQHPQAEGAPTPTVEVLYLCLPSMEEK